MAETFCAHCGRITPASARFCGHCGATLPVAARRRPGIGLALPVFLLLAVTGLGVGAAYLFLNGADPLTAIDRLARGAEEPQVAAVEATALPMAAGNTATAPSGTPTATPSHEARPARLSPENVNGAADEDTDINDDNTDHGTGIPQRGTLAPSKDAPSITAPIDLPETGGRSTPTPDVMPILRTINQLGRLETASYDFEKVIRLEDTRIVPEDHIFVAHGTVVAGIDLSEIEEDDLEVVDSTTIIVHLPEAHIFSDLPVLDNERSYVADRNTGAPSEAEIGSELRDYAEEALIEDASQIGILERANQNGQDFIRNLLKPLGFEEVCFTENC